MKEPVSFFCSPRQVHARNTPSHAPGQSPGGRGVSRAALDPCLLSEAARTAGPAADTIGAVREPFRNEQHGWSLFLRPPDLTVWQRDLDGAGFEFVHKLSA
jgi:hypothetical protein